MNEAAELIQSLVDGPLGVHIRELFLKEVHAELASMVQDPNDQDHAWAAGTDQWLSENWG